MSKRLLTKEMLAEVENKLGFTFPSRHRQALMDLTDPINKACDFLMLADGIHGDILPVNEQLHSQRRNESWPKFLIAFASNGCGDYYAYDIRQNPPMIIYIDPDNTIEGNLCSPNKLSFRTFEDWYDSQIKAWSRN